MSVSGGLKKYSSKNYYVDLISGDKKSERTKIQPWTRVYELKTKIAKQFGVTMKFIRLFYLNTEMIDTLSMLDYHVIDEKRKSKFNKIRS